LNADLMMRGSNRVDAFPSLHCAVTAFTLLFDRVHAPRRFRLWLLPIIGLWIATIYLRYHYLTDVIAGMALAGAALAMVRLIPWRTAVALRAERERTGLGTSRMRS
jgi:membrane-associated phospholipid phosphatase